MQKTIITVVGKDTVGIIAKVCAYLAENHVNILDIAQTIVDGLFQHDDDRQMLKLHPRITDQIGGGSCTHRTRRLGVQIKCTAGRNL